MNELIDILNQIDTAPETLTEMVYEYLGGWSARDWETGEIVERGEVTWEEAAELVERGLNTWN